MFVADLGRLAVTPPLASSVLTRSVRCNAAATIGDACTAVSQASHASCAPQTENIHLKKGDGAGRLQPYLYYFFCKLSFCLYFIFLRVGWVWILLIDHNIYVLTEAHPTSIYFTQTCEVYQSIQIRLVSLNPALVPRASSSCMRAVCAMCERLRYDEPYWLPRGPL